MKTIKFHSPRLNISQQSATTVAELLMIKIAVLLLRYLTISSTMKFAKIRTINSALMKNSKSHITSLLTNNILSIFKLCLISSIQTFSDSTRTPTLQKISMRLTYSWIRFFCVQPNLEEVKVSRPKIYCKSSFKLS